MHPAVSSHLGVWQKSPEGGQTTGASTQPEVALQPVTLEQTSEG